MKLKTIADQPMTYYEVCQVLKACTEAIERMPHEGIVTKTDESMELATSRLLDGIKKINNELLAVEVQVEQAEQKFTATIEGYYSASYARWRELDKKMKSIPPLPEISVPHGVAEIINLAERCSYFTDEQWARVIDLAKALAAKG